MPFEIGPDQILQASVSPRWAALTTVGAIAADLQNYDAFLLRDPRLLVPVDVQALVVRTGVNDTEPMVRLPFRTDDPGSYPPLDVHDLGVPRPPGVHLLWTTPDALGRGRIVPDPAAPEDATRRRLQLPALPDRWVVVRLVVPAGGTDPTVTGWVVDAAAGAVTPLADWPATTTNTQAVARPVPAARLDVHAGGTSWTLCYDAAVGRLSFHDPLTDLAGVEIEGDAITYLVAGWWSTSDHDPLNGVGSDIAYHQRLADLGWNDVDHPSAQQDRRSQTVDRYRAATTFGLPFAGRYTQATSATQGNLGASRRVGLAETAIAGSVASGARMLNPASSAFLNVARQAALLAPAPTQSTLLHGRIHGVPLNGALGGDGRPAEETLGLVLGSSTPEVAGAVASARTGIGADDTEAGERLLAAFTAGLVMQLGPGGHLGRRRRLRAHPRVRLAARWNGGSRPVRRQAVRCRRSRVGFPGGADRRDIEGVHGTTGQPRVDHPVESGPASPGRRPVDDHARVPDLDRGPFRRSGQQCPATRRAAGRPGP